jgi:long-chain acyl-CoA synthetase
VNGNWENYYIDEYIEKANLISYALLNLGVEKGENIALIANGRPEWNYIDMGVQQIGAVLLPIYPTISEEDYLYILSHSNVRYIILETAELLRKIKNILSKIDSIKDIYTINPCDSQPSLESLYELGRNNACPERLQKIKDSITTDDVCTLIYTSGSTGTPKGVMLAHKGLLVNIEDIKESPAKDWDTTLSWLPLCHIYERMMGYLYQYLAIQIWYAESIAKVADDCKLVRPHMMTAVPRFVEKVYDKIHRNGEKLTGVKKKIFDWAIDLGFEYDLDESKLSAWYKLQRKIADKLVYKTIRESMGGRLQMLVSGGAIIQPRLSRLFSCIGLDLYEGYGLTECSPLIAVTNSNKAGRRIGSVGFKLRVIDVKTDPKNNEILVKGDNVMKGYYNDPERTAEVMDKDGWFHTGDCGYFDKDGYLFLTGRTKSMFKTSMGKYIIPEMIEEKMKESPFILDMIVVGEGQKFAAAVIAPDFDMLKDWCPRHNIDFTSKEEVIANKMVQSRYQQAIDKYNAQLGSTEQVKKFVLVPETWSTENKFLTPTLKVIRRNIQTFYSDKIAELFK